MKLTLRKSGILTDPDLHDGFIDSLSVAQEKNAVVECRCVTGKKISIQMLGIEGMVGNDLRQGNIIDTIYVFQGSKIPAHEISGLLFGKYSKQDDITARVAKIHNSTSFFVHFIPSYGLELKALCQEIRIVQ